MLLRPKQPRLGARNVQAPLSRVEYRGAEEWQCGAPAPTPTRRIGDTLPADRGARTFLALFVTAGKGVATSEEEKFLMPPNAAALTLKLHCPCV